MFRQLTVRPFMGCALSAVSRKTVRNVVSAFFCCDHNCERESGRQLDLSRSLINRLIVVISIVHLIIHS